MEWMPDESCADEFKELKKRYEPWVSKNYECAEYWKPDFIEWLVVAESPPSPETREEWASPRYIYRVRERRKGGHLLGAVLSGFVYDDLSKLRHAKRLAELRKARIFVLDVCEYPIDTLPHDRRINEVEESLTCFNKRLGARDPRNIIVLGRLGERKFGSVVRDGLEPEYKSLIRNDYAIPFPHRGNYADCRDGIRLCIENSRRSRKH